MRTNEDLAWAAGLFEGEGCIMFRRKTAVELALAMVDRDVVKEFQAILGCGTIKKETRRRPHQDIYRWSLYSREKIGPVLVAFLPRFKSRRREKALEALNRLAANPGRSATRTHCRNGHEYTPENTYVRAADGYRQCNACRREYAREYMRKQRLQEVGGRVRAER